MLLLTDTSKQNITFASEKGDKKLVILYYDIEEIEEYLFNNFMNNTLFVFNPYNLSLTRLEKKGLKDT